MSSYGPEARRVPCLGNRTLKVENKIYQQIIVLCDTCPIISKLKGGEIILWSLDRAERKRKDLELSFEGR